MTKIKTFFQSFIKTFTSPKYYRDIIKAPFGFSLKFYYFYFLLYTIVATIFFGIYFIRPANQFLNILPGKISSLYPDELIITIKNGEASTNVAEPFFIPLSQVEQTFKDWDKKEVLGQSTAVPQINHLLVIDTQAQPEEFPNYQTAALLTKNYFVYINKNNNFEVMSLDKVGNVTINKGLVVNILDIVSPYLKYISPVLIAVVFFSILIFLPLWTLLYVVLFSLAAWILAKIFGVALSYGKSIQVNMHLVVIPTTIFGVLGILGLSISFPFLRTLIMLVLTIIVFQNLEKPKKAKAKK